MDIRFNNEKTWQKFCEFFRNKKGYVDCTEDEVNMSYNEDDVNEFVDWLVNETGKEVEKPRIEFVEFEGQKYPYRIVYHNEAARDVLIGCGTLDRSLFNEDGDYVSDEAEKVDDMFYGFVEDIAIIYMNDNDLEIYVNKVLD